MTSNLSFGYWVRRRRKALDLTQEELARRVSCALATIKKIEMDERRPSRPMAERLAECLQVSASERPAFLQAARAELAARRLTLAAEPVFQELAIPDIPADASIEERTNLPTPATRLVGRRGEAEEVIALLRRPQSRLLTLTGPGGVGKTRLAVHVAWELMPSFPDGAWLVELAALSDAKLAVHQLASVLGVLERSGTPLIETIAAALRRRRMLLILDNCEHLVEACARICHDLLARCPNLSILATSREPLHIAGETAWQAPPLGLPDRERTLSFEELSQVESVRLFVERAGSSLPSFSLTEVNSPAVAQICLRLDGLPLAIELAAARVAVLTPEQIAQRLDDAFRLLSSGDRSALPKQQTLQATLDWSHDLLSEKERLLARRLAIFVGGFRLEAMEAVCEAGGTGTGEILGAGEGLGLLAQLVDKSLVTFTQEEGGTRRYRLLETVRQYASKKLSEAGELEELRERHARYFLGLVEAIEPKLQSAESLRRLDELEAELDNLRAALEWYLGETRRVLAEDGLRMAILLGRFWSDRCYFSEGGDWLERGIAAVDPDEPRLTEMLGKAYGWIGGLMMDLAGDANQESRRYFEKSIACSWASGDWQSLAGTLRMFAKNVYFAGDHESAHRMVEESLEICRANGDSYNLAHSLGMKAGLLSWMEQNYEQARLCLEESTRLFLENGDLLEAEANYSQMGMIAMLTGEYDQARRFAERALQTYRRNRDKAASAWACHILGRTAHLQGDYPAMMAYFDEGQALEQEMGRDFWLGFSQLMIGFGLVHTGELRQAVEKFKVCQTAYGKIGAIITLLGWAQVASALGQSVPSARLLAAFDGLLPERNRAQPHRNESVELERAVTAVRQQTDVAAFEAAWAEGQAMTFEQALEEAAITADLAEGSL